MQEKTKTEQTVKSYPKEKDKPKTERVYHNQYTNPRKSPELIEAILDHILYGKMSLVKACQKENLSDGLFHMWMKNDAALQEKYTHICEIRWLSLADEIFDVADDNSNDDVYTDDGKRAANNEWLSRSRLRVDTRKWFLSKVLPKIFGDKIEVDNKGELGLNITVKHYADVKNEDE